MATEIENQTIRWISDLVGFPSGTGLMLSGGNMANMTAFWAARHAKATWDLRRLGIHHPTARPMTVYAAKSVHTWIDKAAELSGLGSKAVRRIPLDEQHRLDTAVLRAYIEADLLAGCLPFLVVGTAGTVSSGVVDPLGEIAAICREFGIWFHIDGAYGAFAAMLPERPVELGNLGLADSLALDPHKWLYAPLEAGCLLVRDEHALIDTFAFHPDYYHFQAENQEKVNYYELGPQNSRGFKALKVWLGLRQAGRQGYEQMLRDDIKMAGLLFELVASHPDFEALSHNLSITNFRFVPADLPADFPRRDAYLDQLNMAVMERLRQSGEAFLSNAFLGKVFTLRACVVNFRSTAADIAALPDLVAELGRELDAAMRHEAGRQVGEPQGAYQTVP